MAGSDGPRVDLDAVKKINKYFVTKHATRLQHASIVIYSFPNAYYLPAEQNVFQSFILLEEKLLSGY